MHFSLALGNDEFVSVIHFCFTPHIYQAPWPCRIQLDIRDPPCQYLPTLRHIPFPPGKHTHQTIPMLPRGIHHILKRVNQTRHQDRVSLTHRESHIHQHQGSITRLPPISLTHHPQVHPILLPGLRIMHTLELHPLTMKQIRLHMVSSEL